MSEEKDVAEVKSRVLSRISADLSACDCLVALFHSAASSYRHDTVLKPFPPVFVMKDGTKDIDGLVSVSVLTYQWIVTKRLRGWRINGRA